MDYEIIASLKRFEEKLCAIEKALLEEQKKVLSFSEAAKYTGFSKSFLYKLTASGSIFHYKPNGKMIFFLRDELDTYLLSNKIKDKAAIEQEVIKYCVSSNKKGGSHGK